MILINKVTHIVLVNSLLHSMRRPKKHFSQSRVRCGFCVYLWILRNGNIYRIYTQTRTMHTYFCRKGIQLAWKPHVSRNSIISANAIRQLIGLLALLIIIKYALRSTDNRNYFVHYLSITVHRTPMSIHDRLSRLWFTIRAPRTKHPAARPETWFSDTVCNVNQTFMRTKNVSC